MRTWLVSLGGLLIWAAHFFALYIVASVFPGSVAARWLTLALTLLALGALVLLIRSIRGRNRASADISRWLNSLAVLGASLAVVAVAYQGLPALLA